ncbi:MAG: hypothetical protein ACKO0Z_09200 [Betaproteobacteria bacterium]
MDYGQEEALWRAVGACEQQASEFEKQIESISANVKGRPSARVAASIVCALINAALIYWAVWCVSSFATKDEPSMGVSCEERST